MDRENCIKLLKENIETIQQYGVKSIGIFGSTVHNQKTVASDVDVLVEYQPSQLNLNTYMDLKYYLEELFQCPVDLVTKSSIKPYLKKHILGETVYAA